MTRDFRFSLNEFLERLWAEQRLRQRVAALTGVTVFFGAALIVVGLGEVVLVVVGLAALAGLLALIAWSVPRPELQLIRGAAALATRAAKTVERQRAPAAPTIRKTHAGRQAVAPPTTDELDGWPYAGSAEAVRAPLRAEPTVDEERRRALELNARGTQLRRAGSPAPAAALHLEALEIFRSLGDRHAQASTLNCLALALAATGETDGAVERFEESLLILRELPNDPEQGKVIANLGFILLKHGSNDRGRELLNEALEKLAPESPAAHKIEAQLRRAS